MKVDGIQIDEVLALYWSWCIGRHFVFVFVCDGIILVHPLYRSGRWLLVYWQTFCLSLEPAGDGITATHPILSFLHRLVEQYIIHCMWKPRVSCHAVVNINRPKLLRLKLLQHCHHLSYHSRILSIIFGSQSMTCINYNCQF